MDDQIPPALISEFRKEKVVLFIGSGMSISGGLPDWLGLLNRLTAQFLSSNKEETTFFETLDPTQQAQYLYDIAGKARVVNEIQDIFSRDIVGPSGLHELVVSLPVRCMITTNWDDLIESSFQQMNKVRMTTIWKDSQISGSSNRSILIKFHGDINDPKYVVFSEDDYYNNITRNKLMDDYVSTILSTSTLLFIGYSYSDFDFKLLYNHIRHKIRDLAKNSYIFLPNANSLRTSYLQHRGLEPIVFRAVDASEATETFLKELSDHVAITSTDAVERLRIHNRENTAVLPKAKGMVIRNHANLGPLATPANPRNVCLFGDEIKTSLEAKCTQGWVQLLKKGASAKCIICLNKDWMFERYDASAIDERLKTLSENIQSYHNVIEIVDGRIPVSSSLDIYGKEVYIENKKLGYNMKGYSQIVVHRDPLTVTSAIRNFDLLFEEVKAVNLMDARKRGKGGAKNANDYVLAKIEEILKYISRRRA